MTDVTSLLGGLSLQDDNDSNSVTKEAVDVTPTRVKTIYVLKCTEDKYYVGKTDKNVEERFTEHATGNGSAWTQLHPACDIVDTLPDTPFMEDAKTLEYMRKYGIDNVRGGKYSLTTLPQSERDEIERSIRHENNECLGCGAIDHFVLQCPSRVVKSKSLPIFVVGHNGGCFRCGRSSHWASNCYATTHLDGHYLL